MLCEDIGSDEVSQQREGHARPEIRRVNHISLFGDNSPLSHANVHTSSRSFATDRLGITVRLRLGCNVASSSQLDSPSSEDPDEIC